MSHPKAAQDMLMRACDDGYKQACLECYHRSGGERFRLKSCEQGSLPACANQAVVLESDEARYLTASQREWKSTPQRRWNAAQIPEHRVDTAAIKRLVDQKNEDIKHCYTINLAKRSDAQGRAEAKFLLDEQSNIFSIRVRTTGTVDDDIKVCIYDVLDSIHFAQVQLRAHMLAKTYVFKPEPARK